MIHSYVTIGGCGTRLKGLSPKDKHLLYYKNYRIIDWIKTIVPDINVIGEQKTSSRKETLSLIPIKNNVLIIDCDIIPFGFNLESLFIDNDCVFAFHSIKNKYGSIIVENGKVVSCSETNSISNTKCSGIYFLKDLEKTLSSMVDNNSIISGMIGASVILEDTFLRLGDVEDYLESIKKL